MTDNRDTRSDWSPTTGINGLSRSPQVLGALLA